MTNMSDDDYSTEDMDSDTTEEEDEEEDSDSDEPVNTKITLKARKDRRSRGRWKVLCDKKVFRPEWRDMFSWVDEHPSDSKMVICKYCNTPMKAMKNILDAHQRSKKHSKNAPDSEFIEEKTEKPETNKAPTGGIDPIDEQISFFTESPADAAHQAVTSLIDKLVEKYQQNKLENLKVQNEAILQLNIERAKLIRSENQRKLEHRLQQEAFLKEAQETHLKLMQIQHETMLSAMEEERDAKLRAVEQELVFAKQEYEKKVRLLDSQLSSMK